MSDAITATVEGEVRVVRIDDGKANAVSSTLAAALHREVDAAEAAGQGLAFLGRPGKFSAGFDLGEMGAGPDAARNLVRTGGELALRLYEFPRPVVCGATGHAMAMGAILLLAADTRIGIRGGFKIGLNETAIGLALPAFGLELARERLSKRHLSRAVLQAEIYDPEAAVDAGYLDHVVDPEDLDSAVVGAATALAGLNPKAYAATKKALRSNLVATLRSGLDADLDRVFG